MRLVLALMAAASLSGAASVATASGEGGDSGADVFVVPMDELRVPIVDGNRADGVLRVELALEMADAASAEAASARVPRLRAGALLAAVEFGRLYASPATPVDAGRLARDLTAALRREDGQVARVLLLKVAAGRA